MFARVLRELVDGFPGCFHYLDDIVIVGLTEEEHDLNLAKFLELASTAGIHFNSSKSSLKKTSLTFLVHEISQGTIKPSPSRLHPILDYAAPSNFKQLERFLGLAVYHSKWVPDFSSLAAPLFDVKAEKGPFPSSAICENSIQLIKQAIAASLLVVPDPNKSYDWKQMLLLLPSLLHYCKKDDLSPSSAIASLHLRKLGQLWNWMLLL